ncbi:hypothetical protein EV426DRAFT_582979 [Tirmania nivea]|nr:hypothetical protein EV426DRAFT_582979 [Tirmania nivea]
MLFAALASLLDLHGLCSCFSSPTSFMVIAFLLITSTTSSSVLGSSGIIQSPLTPAVTSSSSISSSPSTTASCPSASLSVSSFTSSCVSSRTAYLLLSSPSTSSSELDKSSAHSIWLSSSPIIVGATANKLLFTSSNGLGMAGTTNPTPSSSSSCLITTCPKTFFFSFFKLLVFKFFPFFTPFILLTFRASLSFSSVPSIFVSNLSSCSFTVPGSVLLGFDFGVEKTHSHVIASTTLPSGLFGLTVMLSKISSSFSALLYSKSKPSSSPFAAPS